MTAVFWYWWGTHRRDEVVDDIWTSLTGVFDPLLDGLESGVRVPMDFDVVAKLLEDFMRVLLQWGRDFAWPLELNEERTAARDEELSVRPTSTEHDVEFE